MFDISQTGAATIRRLAAKSPLQLLHELACDDPTADRDRLFNTWLVEMLKHDGTPEYVFEVDGYIWAVVRYGFANLLSTIDRDKRADSAVKKSAEERNKINSNIELQAQNMSQIDALKRQLLLDWVLPNGKQLRHCTGAECIKEGGWLTAVGRKVGKRIVGDVLSEKQVAALRK